MKAVYTLVVVALLTFVFGEFLAFLDGKPGASAYSVRAPLAILCNPTKT